MTLYSSNYLGVEIALSRQCLNFSPQKNTSWVQAYNLIRNRVYVITADDAIAYGLLWKRGPSWTCKDRRKCAYMYAAAGIMKLPAFSAPSQIRSRTRTPLLNSSTLSDRLNETRHLVGVVNLYYSAENCRNFQTLLAVCYVLYHDLHVRMCVCVYVCIYLCMCVCVFIYLCMYMCVYVGVQAHKNTIWVQRN